MAPGVLRIRTKAFATAILRLIDRLPETPEARIVQGQLGRCGTSVGANYRRACLAQSARDFIAKLKVVEEEVDETEFWLELIQELGLAEAEAVNRLRNEASQILAMTIASIRTSRERRL